MSARVLTVVGCVLLAGCVEGGSSSPDTYVSVPQLLAPGIHGLEVNASRPSGVTAVISVEQASERILQQQLTLTTPDSAEGSGYLATTDFLVREPGELKLSVEFFRDGASLGTVSKQYRVWPTMTVTEHLPRDCRVFTPLNVPETLFDCDGTVVNSDGAVVEGKAASTNFRVLRSGDGYRRWLRDEAGLRLESEAWRSNTVEFVRSPVINDTFTPEDEWAASSQFAVAGRALVVERDGALEHVSFDAGKHATKRPLFAASRDGVHVVVLAGRRVGRGPVQVCRLVIDGASAQLEACVEFDGMPKWQDLTDESRVLVDTGYGHGWLDVFDPGEFSLQRVYRWREDDVVPTWSDGMFGSRYVQLRTGVASRAAPHELLIPVLPGYQPELGREDRAWFRASSHYVWGTSAGGGDGTWWARIP